MNEDEIRKVMDIINLQAVEIMYWRAKRNNIRSEHGYESKSGKLAEKYLKLLEISQGALEVVMLEQKKSP